MNTVCTNILRLHQKKLIPYGGAPPAFFLKMVYRLEMP